MFLQDTQRSWTDDLPVCKESGVGFSTNQIYREDGNRQEEHPFEDRSFHCKYDDSTYLYAVFDGHEGTNAATFAMQRMTAEILLGQLNDKNSDEEIKEVLRQAFTAVERGYIDSMGDRLAKRTSLQLEILEGLNSYEAYQKYPDEVNELKTLNCELSAGTSAVVALIYKNKLYVANVGDSRALLCRTDNNQVLRVVQLSVDHDLKNEDELLRLSQLGLNVRLLMQGSYLGNQESTRCLGNYLVKGGYKEFEELSSAITEPIIAEPEIHGGIELDESCKFLLLMSRGLYKSLEEAINTEQVNKDIALRVVEQYKIQSTLTGVAQAVVDQVVRIHHDVYMNKSSSSLMSGKRDDITLLLRSFDFPMPNALKNPMAQLHFNSDMQMSNTSEDGAASSMYDSETNDEVKPLNNDSKPKIKAYCDFSEFYDNVEKRKKEGTLHEDLKSYFS